MFRFRLLSDLLLADFIPRFFSVEGCTTEPRWRSAAPRCCLDTCNSSTSPHRCKVNELCFQASRSRVEGKGHGNFFQLIVSHKFSWSGLWAQTKLGGNGLQILDCDFCNKILCWQMTIDMHAILVQSRYQCATIYIHPHLQKIGVGVIVSRWYNCLRSIKLSL